MLNLLNTKFDSSVTVTDAQVCFDGCEFAVQGSSNKDKVPGLKIAGAAAVEVKNSIFNTKGYQAISIESSAPIKIENNVFNCSNNYNPIESTISASGVALTNVAIKNNEFNGVCGNNYINFYTMEDNAVVNLEENNFTSVSRNSEVLRLSNTKNNHATFNVKNNSYLYSIGAENDYTSFIMCQDFTKKKGTPQDFSKYTINIDNLQCNGQKVTASFVPEGSLAFTYEDGTGIIENNNPVINIQ